MRSLAGRLGHGLTRAASGYAERTGWLGGLAVVLVVLGALALASETQSPSFLRLSGQPVSAVELGNTVNYSFHGQEYTFVASGRSQDAPAIAVTVYVDPSQPELAYLPRLSTEVFDASFVVTPFVLAGISLLVGWRRARAVRQRRPPPRSQGHGFAPGELLAHRAAERSPGLEVGDPEWPPPAA
jgi:hypothetical protein